jgi:hypothetical protein
MERERGQWGSDEGEEGKKGERSVCVLSERSVCIDSANDCDRVGMLNVSNGKSTKIICK